MLIDNYNVYRVVRYFDSENSSGSPLCHCLTKYDADNIASSLNKSSVDRFWFKFVVERRFTFEEVPYDPYIDGKECNL